MEIFLIASFRRRRSKNPLKAKLTLKIVAKLTSKAEYNHPLKTEVLTRVRTLMHPGKQWRHAFVIQNDGFFSLSENYELFLLNTEIHIELDDVVPEGANHNFPTESFYKVELRGHLDGQLLSQMRLKLKNAFDLQRLSHPDGRFKGWHKSYRPHAAQKICFNLGRLFSSTDGVNTDSCKSLNAVVNTFVDKLCFSALDAADYLEKFWFRFESDEDFLLPRLAAKVKAGTDEDGNALMKVKQIIENKFHRTKSVFDTLITPIIDNVKTHKKFEVLSIYLSELRAAMSQFNNPLLLIRNCHQYTFTPVSQMVAELVFSNQALNFPVLWRRVKKFGLPESQTLYQSHPNYCHRKLPYYETEALKRDIYVGVLKFIKDQKSPDQQNAYFSRSDVLFDSTKSIVSSEKTLCFESRGSIFRLDRVSLKKLVPNNPTLQTASHCKPLLFPTKSSKLPHTEWRFFGHRGVMLGYNLESQRNGQTLDKNFEILLLKDLNKLNKLDQQGSMDYTGPSAERSVAYIPVNRDEGLRPIWAFSQSEVFLLFGTKVGNWASYKRGVVAEILELSDCAKVDKVTRIDLSSVIQNFERTIEPKFCTHLPSKQQYFFGVCQSKNWWSGPFHRVRLYAFQWSRGNGTLDVIGTGDFQLSISSDEQECHIDRLSSPSFQMPQFMVSGEHMYCLYHYKPGHIAMFVYHKLAFHQISNGGFKRQIAQLAKTVTIPYETGDKSSSAYCLRLDHENPDERMEYSILQLRIHL